MIRQNISHIEARWEQHTGRPLIYLDQWFWNKLHSDAQLKSDFIEAVNGHSGTILYSFLTLYEMAGLTDLAQLETIYEVMDSMAYGFLDCDAAAVIERQKELETLRLGTYRERNPTLDEELVVKSITLSDGKLIRPSTLLKEMVEEIGENSASRERYERIGKSIGPTLDPLIARARSEPESLERSRNLHRDRTRTRPKPPHTEDLLHLLVCFIVVNENMSMPPSEWRDAFHTLVPVAYCDFVTLDGRWCTFVEQSRFSYPEIAKVFSPRMAAQLPEEIQVWVDPLAVKD